MTTRMRQPTKDALREQLALAAEEIIRLRAELQPPEPEVQAINFVLLIYGGLGASLAIIAILRGFIP